MNAIERKLVEMNGTLDAMYAQEVNRLIRIKYTVSDELAIMRQRDEKPEEFAVYNAYCEQCKADAKAMLEVDD